MLTSMTGYGRATVENKLCKVTVELRSYNHRFSEMTFRIPKAYMQLEDKLKKVISRSIHRGKVELFLSVEGEQIVERKVETDWMLFNAFLQVADEMKMRANVEHIRFPLESLLLDERIVTVTETEQVVDEVFVAMIEATEQATSQLVMMRKQEGKELYKDLLNRSEQLTKLVASIYERAPKVVECYRDRLTKRLKEFLAESYLFDENRLLTEVALFADKSNVEEELTRLDSHIKQFVTIISTGGVVGRKLDFLTQEMHREVNTIGAKANDVFISQTVVELKNELEKVKEQVQNVE